MVGPFMDNYGTGASPGKPQENKKGRKMLKMWQQSFSFLQFPQSSNLQLPFFYDRYSPLIILWQWVILYFDGISDFDIVHKAVAS